MGCIMPQLPTALRLLVVLVAIGLMVSYAVAEAACTAYKATKDHDFLDSCTTSRAISSAAGFVAAVWFLAWLSL